MFRVGEKVRLKEKALSFDDETQKYFSGIGVITSIDSLWGLEVSFDGGCTIRGDSCYFERLIPIKRAGEQLLFKFMQE